MIIKMLLFSFQKDTTIRELNDRLYYGADKFQQYLTRRQPSAASLSAPNDGAESGSRGASATSNPAPQLTSSRGSNRAINEAGQQISSSSSSSEYGSNQRHSHAYSDSGQHFTDIQHRSHDSDPGQLFTNNRRHQYSEHGIDNGAYRSRSNSKTSRISVHIHQNSDDSTSTGDDDSIIPTPRLIMAPPIEQRSNLQTMANVAHVRSLEDISHDSAIENPPDSSDKDSEQIYNSNNDPRTICTPARPNTSVNTLQFPKHSVGTPGSDDSGIAAIYSPVSLPSIYSPLDYKNQRNNPPSRYTYDEPVHATTIV
jgi:hypothetical protein